MQVHLKRYTYSVRPEVDESLLGYMHRLSGRNFHARPQWLKNDIKMLPGQVVLNGVHLARLASISGQDTNQLMMMQSPPAKANRTTFAGWEVSETEIERGRARLCPDCFATRQIHRQIWNLRIITVCPIHRTKLVDRCPVCNDPLLWSRTDLGRCAKGHTLRRTKSDNELVAKEELSGVRALYEKCNAPIPGSQELTRLPEAIAKLDLSELLAFLLVVGRSAMRERSSAWRAAGTYRYDPNNTHRILSAGFEIATKWPESFTLLIGELHTKSQRMRHQVGLGPDVGRIFHMFGNRERRPFLEVVKSAVRRYVAEHQIILQSGTRRMLGYEANDVSDYISTDKAGAILGCSRETARKLAISNKWCSGAPGAGNIIRIDRRKVEEWRKSEAPMTVAEAGRVLGLWETAAFRLFDCGLLRCVINDRDCHRSTGRHLVRKATVDGLRRVIEAPIEPAESHLPEMLISWRNFQLRLNAKHLHAGVALRAMMEGRLRARARDRRHKGFRALLFSFGDLLPLTVSREPGKAVSSMEGDPSVSMSDAARVMDVHVHSVLRAIQLKLLKARSGRDHRATQLIRLSDLRSFVEQYSTIGRLAKENGVHVNTIRRVLHGLDISPIGGRTGQYGAHPVYSRADLRRCRFENALARTLRSSKR